MSGSRKSEEFNRGEYIRNENGYTPEYICDVPIKYEIIFAESDFQEVFGQNAHRDETISRNIYGRGGIGGRNTCKKLAIYSLRLFNPISIGR